MKHAPLQVSGVAAFLAFLGNVGLAQTTCPSSIDWAALTSLVSSPLITVHFRPGGDVLKVPSKVGVYVQNTLKPKRVELWTGPTGTQVAELYRCADSTQQSVSPGQPKKFTFTITSCREVDNRLEPGSRLQMQRRLTLSICRTIRVPQQMKNNRTLRMALLARVGFNRRGKFCANLCYRMWDA